MKRILVRTAGESHGKALTALVEGMPAGLPLTMERDVDPDLRRRQGGYGRGRRMMIESVIGVVTQQDIDNYRDRSE